MITPHASSGRRGALLGALLLAACGSDFADRSEITSFRFLAIQASPPWVVPGQTSTLRPLVVGQAPGSNLSFRWSWCPLRGPNSAGFECLVTVDDLNTATGTSAPDLPPDFFELGNGATADFDYVFPPELVAEVCAQIRMQQDVSNLITLPDCDGTFPISVRVDASDGVDTITGFKTVRLVYDTAASRQLNTNPDIEGLGLDVRFGPNRITGPIPHETEVTLVLGLPDDVSPLEQLDRLSETYTATRTEANEDNMEIEVPFETREQLIFSWFSDASDFDDARSGFLPATVFDPIDRPDGIPLDEAWDRARANEFVTPRPADFPGGPARIFAVIRDERGGTSWTSTTVQIGSPR